MRICYIAMAFVGMGCASTRVVIEKPIADQCEATGLKGCQQLTEGVLLFVEGDQQRAVHRLRLAINANEPEEVLAFANGLKAISALPGAGQFTAPIQQVVDLLSKEAAHSEDAPAAAKRRASNRSRKPRNVDNETTADQRDESPRGSREAEDSPNVARTSVPALVAAALPPAPAWTNFDGKTVVPANDESTRACAMTGNLWPAGDASKGYCVRVARGPLERASPPFGAASDGDDFHRDRLGVTRDPKAST